MHLPRGFEDRTNIKDIRNLAEGETVCVERRFSYGFKEVQSTERHMGYSDQAL